MENQPIIGNSTWSENASVTSSIENILSYILLFMIVPAALGVSIKSALTIWFYKLIEHRGVQLVRNEFIVLLMLLLPTVSKDFDIFGLTCMWCCYRIILSLMKRKVLIGCAILYGVSSILLAYVPSYFTLLIFIVNNLLVHTMCRFFLADDIARSLTQLSWFMIICEFVGGFKLLYLEQNLDIDAKSLRLMMLVLMIDVALESKGLLKYSALFTMTFFHYLLKKINSLGVSDHDESS